MVQSKEQNGRAPVAHHYNPNYLGSRDQEDYGLKPALSKELRRLYLEKTYPQKEG
jgi:hypothetical protein